MYLKDHEKLFAFLALATAVMVLALLAYFHPIINEGSQRVIDAAMGGLLLALVGAANALFRLREGEENVVKVDQPANQPIPVEPKTDAGELPEEQKL